MQIGLNQCADLAALLDEKMQDIRNKMQPYLQEAKAIRDKEEREFDEMMKAFVDKVYTEI